MTVFQKTIVPVIKCNQLMRKKKKINMDYPLETQAPGQKV